MLLTIACVIQNIYSINFEVQNGRITKLKVAAGEGKGGIAEGGAAPSQEQFFASQQAHYHRHFDYWHRSFSHYCLVNSHV